MKITYGDLLTKLRRRVNDETDGLWSVNVKLQTLYSGRKRTVVRTECYRSTESITVVADTHTYDANEIYQPTIRLGDETLERKKPESMPIITENWDAIPTGTPTKWFPLRGNHFRVSPTPGSAAAGIVATVASTPTAGGTGYAVDEVLEIDEGDGGKVVVTAVSSGVVTAVLLNSAVDGGDQRKYDRGTSYTTGAGKATTAESGSGTGCTLEITALCKLEVYGPATVDDRLLTTAVTISAASNVVGDPLNFTTTAHGLSVGDAIAFTGTGGGVTAYQTYYVATVDDADTFSVSEISGGTEVTYTIAGTNSWGLDEINEISEARADEAMLLAAEEELMFARKSVTNAMDRAAACYKFWVVQCDEIKAAFEGRG